MTKRTKRLLKVADRGCLLAFAVFAVLLTASLSFRSVEPPIVRHVFVDGTTYFVSSNDGDGLILARQSASPKSAGALAINVETLNLIDVFDKGQRLPGMTLARPQHRWTPAMETNVMGWHRGGNVLSGVGVFGPSSIFRVKFQTLTLPAPFLLFMTILTAFPLVFGILRRCGRGFRTSVGQPAAA